MVATYVGTCPYNPELELKNFQQKQVEYEAAYRATGDPQVLHEALLNAHGYLRLPAELNWLTTALGNFITKNRMKGRRKGKASQTVERFQDRMSHVQRYRCIRNLCQKGLTLEQALDLAVEQLAANGEAAAWLTIKDSYNKVRKSLERKKHKSEYFLLVVRADPTVVPVQVNRTADGVTVINGVAQGPTKVTRRLTVT